MNFPSITVSDMKVTAFCLGNIVLVLSLYVYASPSNSHSWFPVALDSPLSEEQIEACARTAPLPSNTTDSIPLYWPPGKLEEGGKSYRTRWFSSQLCAMREIPLQRMPYGLVTMRLLIISDHSDDYVIRIERDISAIRMTRRVWKKPPDHGWGTRELETTQTRLSEKTWTAIEVLLEELPLWNIPTTGRYPGGDHFVWVLEIATADRYHVMERWGEFDIPPVVYLMFALAGINEFGHRDFLQ